MAKLKVPLFSFVASGSLQKLISYQHSPAGSRAISYPDHADALSARQITQRLLFLEAKDYWNSLSAVQKAAYNTQARPLFITGYNLCLRQFLYGELETDCRLLLPALEGHGAICFDHSGYGNDAAILGASWLTEHLLFPLLFFDGVNDYASCGRDESLDLTTGITLEACIYPTERDAFNHVISKLAWSAEGYTGYHLRLNTGKLNYAGHNLAGDFLPGETTLELNHWYHIIATCDLNYCSLFLNGSLDVTPRPVIRPLFTNTVNLYIGRSQIFGDSFAGYILAARVSSHALSTSEVESRYRSLQLLLPNLL